MCSNKSGTGLTLQVVLFPINLHDIKLKQPKDNTTIWRSTEQYLNTGNIKASLSR